MRLLRDWRGNPERPTKQKVESTKAENRGKKSPKKKKRVLRGKALAQPFVADRSFKWINGNLQVLEFHVLVQDQWKLHLGLNNLPGPGSDKRTFHEIPGDMSDMHMLHLCPYHHTLLSRETNA